MPLPDCNCIRSLPQEDKLDAIYCALYMISGGGGTPVSYPLAPSLGGTGIANNDAMTVTGVGNFTYTRTLTGNTNVTFPTSGTLATTSQLPALPVGMMVDYGGTAAPSLWLLCAGQSLLRASYVALFAAIGTTFGAADGTHFTLPDFRGRVAAAPDAMGGTPANRISTAFSAGGGMASVALAGVGGEQAHVIVENELPSGIKTAGTDDQWIGGVDAGVNSTGNNEAHNTMQPTLLVNKIIYAGI